MRKVRNLRGFTLIELLIVVAIIAILAAIAVPNFLEAQTRAKVSRVKADMRTTATAIEAYYVDNNRYMPDYSDVLRGKTKYNSLLQRHAHLTTPVAYLSSVLEDIFAEKVAMGGAKRASGAAQSGAPYSATGSVSGQPARPLPFDYAKFDRVAPVDNPTVWAQITNNPDSIQWALNSAGPNVMVFEYLGFADLVIYDPTNGTVSNGQIIRTNLGADDKPKL